MKRVILLMKAKEKLLSLYALLESSSYLCMLSLKSLMEQLQVGCETSSCGIIA